LELAQNQIMKAINTVTELEKAVHAFSRKNHRETAEAIDRLFNEEEEIDELRRAVFSELTKGTLPAKYREDLKTLVGFLDRLADHVKDAARNIQILLELHPHIPSGIMEINVAITTRLVECTKHLSTSLALLGTNAPEANAFAEKVYDAEEQIDHYQLQSKRRFFEYAEDLPTPVFLVLADFIEAIERSADMCADAADFIQVLASGEIAS
jgi:predicted phosphate transport protein (TIGR00153 family)